jgi:hypothetical protein
LLLKRFDRLSNDIGRSGSIDGHRSQPSKNRSQGQEKPGAFHLDAGFDPVIKRQADDENKIPIGCAGRGNDKILWQIRFLAFRLPARYL